MIRFTIHFLLLFCGLSFTLPGQQSYAEPLDNYNAKFFPEKLFIHTDKQVYAGGETVYAAIYLLNGISHQPDSLSKTVYLELVDAEGKLQNRLSLFAADGHMAASIELPATIVPGDYQLAAYTNFQRNGYSGTLFRKSLQIVSGLKESGGAGNDGLPTTAEILIADDEQAPEVSLRFFPESGDCATGIPCRVVMVSELRDGTPVPFIGTLSRGEEMLQAVNTNERGIGSFTFKPTEKPMAVMSTTTGRSYRVPEPRRTGAHIRIDVAPDTVDITMSHNDPQRGLLGHTFVLHLRGAGLLEQPFTDDRPKFKMRLPTPLLPAGVIIASLLDAAGNPVAERLFFIPPEETNIQLSLDREQYGLRAPVDLSLSVPQTSLPDSLNATRLSLSVLPAAAAGGLNGDDIRTWVLLNSDIDHPVQQAPELVFGEGTPEEKARRIDEFLLTRAWRRFRWEQLPELPEYQPEYLLERGLFIRGQMTKFDTPDAPRPGKVFLARMANGFYDEALTDEAGYFTLGPYFATDTFPVLLQGRFKPGRKNRLSPAISLKDNKAVNLKILPYEGVDWSALPTASELFPPPRETLVDYAEVSRKTLTVARTYDSLIIDLQTIDVSAQRIDPVEKEREARTKQLYSAPTRRIVVADNAFAQTTPFITDVLNNLPGVRRFTNPEGEVFFNIRNTESIGGGPLPAALYLDGLLTRIGSLAAIQMRQVEFIDVLTPQRAVRLGPDAEGGAIMIYRYADGRGAAREQGVLEATLTGYHTVREFATFDPSLPDNRNRPDIRTTLHWEPLLRSGSNGSASTSFTTSDQLGEFFIFVQGLRNDGTPLYGEGVFRVDDGR